MGVFARLFQRSRTTEEAQSAEAEATQVTAEAEATDEAKSTAEARDAVEAGAGSEATAGEAGQTAAEDGVGIPKQQSAEEVADSEAEEGART
ncbi:hypothetical protein ABT173_17095 [Streptomyces sp. NPDC001795]|uniref:hypothetical protein n=1 Tax=unclassified Streptomyces TaxID=2593676 RepID=UPI00331F9FDB